MAKTLDHPRISQPPALTALLVYLRPAPRRSLLTELADLGVFVVEHQGVGGVEDLADFVGADVILVLAPAAGDGLQLVGRLSSGPAPVVVSVPRGVAGEAFLGAGAMACIPDDELGRFPGGLLASIANRARSNRADREDAGVARNIGALVFEPGLPAISLDGRSRALSRSERAVLLRLAATPGRPVDLRELERAATPPGMQVRPGFLKAVVLRLRRKIEELGGDPNRLATVRGYGYVLAKD